MDDVEVTSKGDRCETCKYYIMIDSGFGYCRRYPPITECETRGFKKTCEDHYQLTSWCRIACGEFKQVMKKQHG